MFDEPAYVSFTTLELSGSFMYETHYDNLQPFFDPNLEIEIQVHYMSYDSVVWSIKTDALVKKLQKEKQETKLFHFSDLFKEYPKSSSKKK